MTFLPQDAPLGGRQRHSAAHLKTSAPLTSNPQRQGAAHLKTIAAGCRSYKNFSGRVPLTSKLQRTLLGATLEDQTI